MNAGRKGWKRIYTKGGNEARRMGCKKGGRTGKMIYTEEGNGGEPGGDGRWDGMMEEMI